MFRTLREVREGQRPSAAQHNMLVRAALQQRTGRGLMVDSSGQYERPQLSRRSAATSTIALFKITESSQVSSTKRWTYTAHRQIKSTPGYDGWANDPADVDDEGAQVEYTLYSMNEATNSSSGIYGNGVSQSNINVINSGGGTFAIKPIPVNTVVAAIRFVVQNGAVPELVEWWIINLSNGVDGACPP